jgi:hypothetical protein
VSHELAGRSALLVLQGAHAFDPVPLRSGVHGWHVPFDDLTHSQRTEAALSRAVLGIERVAIVGLSGVGKTSLIQHVLGELVGSTAMIRVPVEAEDELTVTDPAAFAGHLIRTVARYLTEAGDLTEPQRLRLVSGTTGATTTSRSRGMHVGVGLPPWTGQLDIAGDLRSVLQSTVSRSGSELIAHAAQIVDTIGARGLQPVLVIDDSDAWLATEVGNRTALVGPFFGRVVRMLAEELTASLVVAVHTHYFDLDAFPRGRGFLEEEVRVPALPDDAALSRILAARVSPHLDTPLPNVIDTAGISALFRGYLANSGNIRSTLLLAHTALQIACEDGADRINGRHIEAATARYSELPG